MTSTSRGLGNRSLTAARQQAAETRLMQGAPEVLLDELLPSPENGRDVREETADPRAWEKVLKLAEAIRTDGVNTALTVVTAAKYVEHYPQHQEHVRAQGLPYVVIHGHRRLAAARVAGLTKVPVLLKQDVVQIRIAAIQENLLREGLDPIAEGQQYQLAMAESGLSQRALAKRLGNVSQTTISHRLALLQTVPEVQEKVLDEFYEPKSGITVAFAAKHLARVLPFFQRMFVEGAIAQAEVVALSTTLTEAQEKAKDGTITLAFVYEHLSHLRDEFQAMFLRGEITAEDVIEIGKVPAKDQQRPAPGRVIAGQSPADAADTSVPAPRPEAQAPAGQDEVIAGQSLPGAAEVPEPGSDTASLLPGTGPRARPRRTATAAR
ncbi:ParB/RepB/Spo0J family partition protein [Kitasatospora cineracea]|uniref:ParB/RepB/Spo0J family partition protein n=1 Tax=Kitasatospora cineracea TaxID=88074 RepID=A0A3N4RTM0_9ACTN|nr:ParB/RepB/Spo0J family partition protein [Kitasatospora cineracea]RPE27354.1 ParB/RepB/Spo0J family partition protein [Kitasatospora cineracea]